MSNERLKTGVNQLDAALGGGLIPGTLTVVIGVTGIGKTQLGLQFLDAARKQEGLRGMVLDFTARGDAQNHRDYAKRISAWDLNTFEPPKRDELGSLLEMRKDFAEYFPVVSQRGRTVSKSQMTEDEWRDWQAEWNREMHRVIAFLYAGFCSGRQRIIIDGIEPIEGENDSAQLHLFEYIYHKVIRQDPEWVARELFREHFRSLADKIAQRSYSCQSASCLMLVTTTELMLDTLLQSPAAKPDLIANANTVIVMGKTRQNGAMGRALYIAKHRGSYIRDEILPFSIDDTGIRMES